MTGIKYSIYMLDLGCYDRLIFAGFSLLDFIQNRITFMEDQVSVGGLFCIIFSSVCISKYFAGLG